jgi:hypothetical protein
MFFARGPTMLAFQIIATAAQIAVVFVFMNASSAKGYSAHRFTHWIRDWTGWNLRPATYAAWLVVCAEFCLTLLLANPWTLLPGVISLVIALVAFTAVAFKSHDMASGCPCFGPVLRPSSKLAMIGRNVAICALGLLALISPGGNVRDLLVASAWIMAAIVYWVTPLGLRLRFRQYVRSMASQPTGAAAIAKE